MNSSNLNRQEKIELLKKYIGKKEFFICRWHVREEEQEFLAKRSNLPLSLCLKCYDRYYLLRDLEEKCECGCEKCKC